MSPTQPVNEEAAEYCETIESTFVSRRGSHLMLSPTDWQLMADWQQREIPAHIVVSAINQVFDQRRSGQRTATINSLKYCASAVEDAHRNWLANRVGANDATPTAAAPANNPFSKESMLSHLSSRRDLVHRANAWKVLSLSTALQKALDSMEALENSIRDGEMPARMVEQQLTALDTDLDAEVKAAAAPGELTENGRAVTKMLAPHRSSLSDQIYQQQFNNFLIKRLRESFGIPRLSLFFAK